MPVCVSPCCTSSERAIPKSVTLRVPVAGTSTFCGLTSRCTSPFACAKASARAVWSASSIASRTGSGAAPLDQLLQVLAVDELEDDELAPVLLAAVDHGDDVRVGELRDRARLVAEALDVVVVAGVLLVQDLERDPAVEQLSCAR